MPRLRSLIVLVFVALCAPVLRAHGPLECTLGIFKNDEGYELVSELTLPSAARLLGVEAAETFSAATFSIHRQALEAAVDRLCNLLDPEGRPVASTRDLVSLNRQGEVRIVRLYPADAPADAVRFELLAALPPGQFCIVTDHRADPPGQTILQREKPLYPLAPPPSASAPRP